MSASEPSRTLRFAVFEVDLRNGELRKRGIKVKLQDQPFQVLAMLLAAPGEVVTREELRAKLWPADTFVDFDTGLNTAVKRLRDALGDSAESPRYVETLPRKGYRFICPIHQSQEAFGDSAGKTPRPNLLRRYMKIVVPGLLMVGVGLALVGFRHLRPRPVLSDQDVVVLADLENRTGEPVFDKTLREALTVGLEQSPFFSVMPDTRVDEVLKQMLRSPGDSVTPAVGREICLRTSSKALLTGSIASLGTHYVLEIRAADCQTGNVLAAVSAEADSREKVLLTLDRAVTNLRPQLGESLRLVQRYDKPLEEATTSSLEALQAYSEGDRIYRQKGAAAAIPFFKRAVDLDTQFSSAYTYLGAIYTNVGEDGLSREELTKGFELSERLTALQKYMTSGLYYQGVTGELEKARQQFQFAAEEYPRDFYSRLNLAFIRKAVGDYEEAATLLREAVRLQPDNYVGYYNLCDTYADLGHLDEAQSILNEALTRNLDTPGLHRAMYDLAFLKNDVAAMQRELNWAMGRPVDESFALEMESATQSFYGRLRKAREFTRRAVAGALNNSAKVPAAEIQAAAAITEAGMGNLAKARQMARAALVLSGEKETRLAAAVALASSGDSSGAQTLLDGLNKERPLSTFLQNYWSPAIRARIELNHGHPQRAVELLETATPYDLGEPYELEGVPMYSVYVRGQAYLALGDGSAAAAEFQKILDHRGLVGNDVTGALAHLYLGRARVLEARSLEGVAADNAKAHAIAAYQDFFTLWKDADPDIPILRQAKAEYAKLQ